MTERRTRFYYFRGHYEWMLAGIQPAGAVDCTDMDGDEFEAFWRANPSEYRDLEAQRQADAATQGGAA